MAAGDRRRRGVRRSRLAPDALPCRYINAAGEEVFEVRRGGTAACGAGRELVPQLRCPPASAAAQPRAPPPSAPPPPALSPSPPTSSPTATMCASTMRCVLLARRESPQGEHTFGRTSPRAAHVSCSHPSCPASTAVTPGPLSKRPPVLQLAAANGLGAVPPGQVHSGVWLHGLQHHRHPGARYVRGMPAGRRLACVPKA